MNVTLVAPGDVLSYDELCRIERARLQKGMNFRLRGGLTVVLMSTRVGAPYADEVQDEGRTLIYEGHNASISISRTPDEIDQPAHLPGGGLTENGKFYQAVESYKSGQSAPELVKVYEKIKAGIWVYNGIFRLIDAWQAEQEGRKVWKFRMELVEEAPTEANQSAPAAVEHARMIPSHVKLEVWRRDKGRCVRCGSDENLHFDHIIPYSKGGSSLTAENIQLLCLKHNLAKSDKIE
jgi:hypothetical protein